MASNEEQLLIAVARRSWVGYATAQLAECQAALDLWQCRAQQSNCEFSSERIQHELAYYTRQMARWQQSLAKLTSEA